MTLKEKIQTAWNNRGIIVEGFYNAYVSASPEVKQEALKRLSFCRTNQCGLHDPKGESEQAVFKGKESCGGCGCDLYAKCHAMSAQCYLADIDPATGTPRGIPLWTAVMTQEQELEINKIAYQKQFENRK
jgi:hypothetical protein